jgi:hypothetical protein
VFYDQDLVSRPLAAFSAPCPNECAKIIAQNDAGKCQCVLEHWAGCRSFDPSPHDCFYMGRSQRNRDSEYSDLGAAPGKEVDGDAWTQSPKQLNRALSDLRTSCLGAIWDLPSAVSPSRLMG